MKKGKRGLVEVLRGEERCKLIKRTKVQRRKIKADLIVTHENLHDDQRALMPLRPVLFLLT